MLRLILVIVSMHVLGSPAFAQRWKYPPPQTQVQQGQYETLTFGYNKAWEKYGAGFIEGQWQHECRNTARVQTGHGQADNGGRHLAVYEYGNGFIYVACFRQLITRTVRSTGGSSPMRPVPGPFVDCTRQPHLPECRRR